MNKIKLVFCSQSKNEKELTEKYGKYNILNSSNLDKVEICSNFDNKSSLSQIYNKYINEENEIVVLIHDDMLIQDKNWTEKLIESLKKYDVVGLAGTKAIKISQPCLWHLMCSKEDYRGRVNHVQEDGKGTFATHFGKQGRVLVLDGIFIAFNAKKIFEAGAFFDKTNPCVAHFYDIDFCLTCNSKKLKLGTVDINATHNSHGLKHFTDEWLTGQNWFLQKVKDGKYEI